jgi:hypothetical protein
MSTSRQLIVSALVALLAVIVPSVETVAAAPSAPSFFSQSGTVFSSHKFNAVQHIETFRVTEDDIRRGYADLAAALTVSYQTDGPETVIVEIGSLGPEQIYFYDAGIMVYMVALLPETEKADPTSLALDLRIMLPSQSVAGVYPLSFYVIPSFL